MSAQLNTQVSIFDVISGMKGRDEGIAKVISNNECFVSTMRGGVVSMDDLRQVMSEYGIKPPEHQNAFGGIFRGNEWQCVGMVKSKLPSNHARMIRTWRLKERMD